MGLETETETVRNPLIVSCTIYFALAACVAKLLPKTENRKRYYATRGTCVCTWIYTARAKHHRHMLKTFIHSICSGAPLRFVFIKLRENYQERSKVGSGMNGGGGHPSPDDL